MPESSKSTYDPYGRYYLHYYYGNYPYANTILSKIGRNKQEVYAVQLLKFRERKQKLKNSLKRNDEVPSWSGIFEDTYLRKSFSDVLEPSVRQPEVSFAMTAEEAVGRIRDFNLTNTANSMNEFSKVVSDAIFPLITGADKGLFESYKKALLDYYATISDGKPLGEFAETALRGILSRYEKKFIEIPNADSSYSKLKDYQKRLVAYIANMEVISSSIGDASLTVERSSKKSQTFDSGEDILQRIRVSIQQSLLNVSKQLSERAVAAVVTKGTKEFLDRLSNVEKNFTANISPTGSKQLNSLQIYSEIVQQPGSTQNEMYRVLRTKSQNQALRKTSKADASLTISDDAVSATLGFTVKTQTGLDFKSNLNGKTLKLQEGTPLYTLLVRELGYNSTEMQGIMQLAVGHGSRQIGRYGIYRSETIEANWNRLMETVQAEALLSALTGLSSENVFYMVLNGKLISIKDIISQIVEFVASGGSPARLSGDRSKNNTLFNNAGLQRKTYWRMNRWIGGKERNTQAANRRAEGLFNKVSNRMYDTKIRIDLNLSSIQSILRTI